MLLPEKGLPMRHFFLKRSLAAALGLAAVACTHNVDPNVTPAKIVTVQPPIQARVLLIIAPAFETYTTESQNGIHHYIVHLGGSASKALQDFVGASFQHLEVQHVSDADLLQWLAAPGGTTRADVLLVPDFAPSSAETRFVDFAADVRLRLNVRSY